MVHALLNPGRAARLLPVHIWWTLHFVAPEGPIQRCPLRFTRCLCHPRLVLVQLLPAGLCKVSQRVHPADVPDRRQTPSGHCRGLRKLRPGGELPQGFIVVCTRSSTNSNTQCRLNPPWLDIRRGHCPHHSSEPPPLPYHQQPTTGELRHHHHLEVKQ